MSAWLRARICAEPGTRLLSKSADGETAADHEAKVTGWAARRGPGCRNPEPGPFPRSLPPVLLRDQHPADRGEPVPLRAHQRDDLIDLGLGHAISGLIARPRRHRPLVGVDVAVGKYRLLLNICR